MAELTIFLIQECVEKTSDVPTSSVGSSSGSELKEANQPTIKITNGNVLPKSKKKLVRNLNQKSEPLSTSLRCYFKCGEVFRKDYQLFLHLKLRHR
jgi:hypothetical protein